MKRHKTLSPTKGKSKTQEKGKKKVSCGGKLINTWFAHTFAGKGLGCETYEFKQ